MLFCRTSDHCPSSLPLIRVQSWLVISNTHSHSIILSTCEIRDYELILWVMLLSVKFILLISIQQFDLDNQKIYNLPWFQILLKKVLKVTFLHSFCEVQDITIIGHWDVSVSSSGTYKPLIIISRESVINHSISRWKSIHYNCFIYRSTAVNHFYSTDFLISELLCRGSNDFSQVGCRQSISYISCG